MKLKKLIKHQTCIFLISLGIIILLVNQVQAQEPSGYSWADSINKGDKFTWIVDTIIEQYESLKQDNSTFSTLQTNTTIPVDTNYNDTVVTSTVTGPEITTTEYTTSVSYDYYNDINNGSVITVDVLKNPSEFQIRAPLLDNEGFGDTSPMNDYFDYKIDEKTNYYLFPVFIMIIPVKVINGPIDNFFDKELTSDYSEFDMGNKSIEDGIFTLKFEESSKDNFSRWEMSGTVTWDVKTGILLNFESVQSYVDSYSIEYNELKISFSPSSDQLIGSDLQLPVSNIWILSVFVLPILRKIRKS